MKFPDSSKRLGSVFWPIAVVLLASGCGGGGGGGGDGNVTGTQSAGIEGVWRGSCNDRVYTCILGICVADEYRTVPAIAIATRDGRLHLFTATFELAFIGQATVSDGRVTGTLRQVCDPLDGPPVFGHVSIDGSFTFQRSLDVSYDVDECIGDGVFNLEFDPTSRQAASLSAIEGVWSSQQAAITIEQSGQMLGSTGSGCQLSGKITPGSDTANIFEVDMLVETCGALDGQFSGLATVTGDSTSSSTLLISTMRSGAIISIGLAR